MICSCVYENRILSIKKLIFIHKYWRKFESTYVKNKELFKERNDDHEIQMSSTIKLGN